MNSAAKKEHHKSPPQFSADFLAWYELAKAYPALQAADGEWERTHFHRRVTDEELIPALRQTPRGNAGSWRNAYIPSPSTLRRCRRRR